MNMKDEAGLGLAVQWIQHALMRINVLLDLLGKAENL
jgi:hypothetical protein